MVMRPGEMMMQNKPTASHISESGEALHRYFDHGAEVRQLTRLANEVGIYASISYYAEAMYGASLEALSDGDLRDVTDAFLPMIIHLQLSRNAEPTIQ